ncbi:hypothetical protein ACJX0J_025136, partial [Zea mays]
QKEMMNTLISLPFQDLLARLSLFNMLDSEIAHKEPILPFTDSSLPEESGPNIIQFLQDTTKHIIEHVHYIINGVSILFTFMIFLGLLAHYVFCQKAAYELYEHVFKN